MNKKLTSKGMGSIATTWAPGLTTAAAVQILLDRLTTLVVGKIGLIGGVDEQLMKLERTILRAQALVDCMEINLLMSQVVRTWLVHVKDTIIDIDDMLDELQEDASSHMRSRDAVLEVDQGDVGLTDVGKLTSLVSKLDGILKEIDVINAMKLIEGRSLFPSSDGLSQQTTSVINKGLFFGRGGIEALIIEDYKAFGSDKVYMAGIDGRFGIGKTGLAKLIFNNDEVVDIFQSRIWVCASIEPFDVCSLARSIVESATGTSCQLVHLSSILGRLSTILPGLKKFLLILDGLYSYTHNEELDDLISVLRLGSNGSAIIITTETKTFIKRLAADRSYTLGALSEEDCLKIFTTHAFRTGNANEHPQLVDIAKQYASKWQGMPLIAKALGRTLSSCTDPKEWKDILESDVLDLPEVLVSVRQASYHLPHHLRQCIAYSSLFSYEFEKDKLLQLWIAEGFIHPRRQKRMEDIASDYFHEFLDRSFFENVDLTTCSMPTSVQALARYISGGECFRFDSVDSCSTLLSLTSPRHLSMLCANLELLSSSKSKRLRTFLLMWKGHIQEITPSLLESMNYVRVLDLSDTMIVEIPGAIKDLKHLRYLDVSRTLIGELPDSITNLYFLQTIRLIECTHLLKLPADMKKLRNLRHLIFGSDPSLVEMPLETRHLSKLQTLTFFPASNKDGCQVGELRDMLDLQGGIIISKLENVASGSAAREAMLANKKNIQKLELKWTVITDSNMTQEVLAGLQPHPNLNELKICSYGGVTFPSWITDNSLSSLIRVSIMDCLNCVSLPALGNLPNLKFLLLSQFPQVETVDSTFCVNAGNGFPKLETLELKGMPIWKRWIDLVDGDLSLLRNLVIDGCLVVTFLPPLKWLIRLQNLEINDCYELSDFPEGQLPTSLEYLKIKNCSKLTNKCLVQEGGYRQRISQIARVEIDNQTIQF